MLEIFIASLVLGAVSGLLAGLFGIGGGLVIVPVLVALFSMQQVVASEHTMIVAIATSLATIVFTAISSVLAHHRRGNVLWYKVFRLTPTIIIGAGMGALIADKITGDNLRFIFIAYLLYVAVQMALQIKPSIGEIKENTFVDYSAGAVIGVVSSILGIGGGTLTVPYLVACKLPMKNAVAVSSACGLPIAIGATVSYIFLGLQQQATLPEWSLGYIYLPAFFGIVICSVLTAPVGAKLATKLPAAKLKRYFSLMLFIMAAKMIFS
ncbi:MAG: TSUP family transporter [Methylococcaceae bacterium]|nr:TSUP family transporter [Methylococcaceae bacterium]